MDFILFWDISIQNERAGIESNVTNSQNNLAFDGNLLFVRRFIGKRVGSTDLVIVDHRQDGRASHNGDGGWG
jgi:hypothetical protein